MASAVPRKVEGKESGFSLCGMDFEGSIILSSGAKARCCLMLFAERLKPCPFKATVVSIPIPNAIAQP
jgi:hypothetical protein